MIDKEQLVNMLQSGVVKVNFTKKDGEVREMSCTLIDSYIPEENKPKGSSERKLSESTLRVFDINAKGWRSFVLANVNSVEVINS